MMAIAALALTSCNEDFGDWLQQSKNEAPTAVTVGGLTFSPVGTIDYRELGDVERVKVANVNAVSTSSEEYNKITYHLLLGDVVMNIDADGTVDAKELQNIVVKLYGREPVERTLLAGMEAVVSNGKTATVVTSDDVLSIVCIPDAPVIESEYYYVGTSNNWGTTKDYPLSNGGVDPYENPVFSVVVPITSDGGTPQDNWFKIVGKSAFDRLDAGGDFWGGDVVGYAENGGNELTGKITVGLNDVVANAFKFDVTANPAKYVRITVNFMEETFTLEPISFADFIYEIGNASGWTKVEPLYNFEGNGKYRGFAYLDGAFKFRPNENDWTGDWEYDGEGKIADNGGPDCPAPAEPGYYMIDVDLNMMTYSLTKIDVITMIGSAINGDTNWGTDYEMTYDRDLDEWVWEGELTAGEFKFRANRDWAVNWGYADGTTAYLMHNGGNIATDGGRFRVALKAKCDGGPATFTMTPL